MRLITISRELSAFNWTSPALQRNTSIVKRRRPNQPQRRSNNDKRRLLEHPDSECIEHLRKNIKYEGSSKYKWHPESYGLSPFNGIRGDATLCDRDAEFTKKISLQSIS